MCLVVRNVINKAKKVYWKNMCNDPSLNEVFKSVRRVKSNNNNFIGIKYNNKSFVDKTKVSNIICKFFSDCGSNKKFRYISERKENKNTDKFSEDLNADITQKELCEVVETLNIKKAEGPDEIAPFMIKFGGSTALNMLKEFLIKYLAKKDTQQIGIRP